MRSEPTPRCLQGLVFAVALQLATSDPVRAGASQTASAALSAAPPAAGAAPVAPDTSPSPQVWFGPMPPLPALPNRPFTGSRDFLQLFVPDAPWQHAASHTAVFELFGEWVEDVASDEQLRQVLADLARRNIAVDVAEGPLTAGSCGEGVESFAGVRVGLSIARRIEAAGGRIDFIDMDEPFYYASRYDGPNACHWPAERVAREVADFVKAMKQELPQVVIGTSEPLPGRVRVEELEGWIETYRAVSGEYFPFFHLDLDYTRDDWPDDAMRLEAFCRARGIGFGMHYLGNWHDLNDEDWLAEAGERVKTYELVWGDRPDYAIFESWDAHPLYSLPETSPDTFTHLVDLYVEDRSAMGFRTTGPRARLAFNKKVVASGFVPGFEPEKAVDGNPETHWATRGSPPQWIEVDLGAPLAIGTLRLRVGQFPEGYTVHRVLGKGPDTQGRYELLHEFSGYTRDLDVLEHVFPRPVQNIEAVRVVTVTSPSWTSWREIEVNAP